MIASCEPDVPKLLVWLDPPPAFTPHFLDGPLPGDQSARVRRALSPHPIPIEEIARAAGLNAAPRNGVLMELELELDLAGQALSYPGVLAARAVQGPVARLHRPGRQKQAGPAGWLDGPLVRL